MKRTFVAILWYRTCLVLLQLLPGWYWGHAKGYYAFTICLFCKDHLFKTRNPWRKFCCAQCKKMYKKGYILDNCNF